MQKKIVTIVGARPQFIKAAPVSFALAGAGLAEAIIHTGQHFDPGMSDVFFEELNIPRPAYNLEINSLSHGAMTGRMLEQIETVLLIEAPDIVLVYGDTNSTLAGALAAAKMHIPLAHVESGLRSFNRKMPEEINRVLTDHMSQLLFCPTQTSVRNLSAEGICEGVVHVGDVMCDATVQATNRAQKVSTILDRLQLSPRSYSVATVHRAENTDNPGRFSEIMAWLESQAQSSAVILVTHPRTRKRLETSGQVLKNIVTIDPLGYLDMTRLVHEANCVYTDSGGLQKEAYFHRVPCVTLREETEWVETIENGWNRLWSIPDYRLRREIPDYGTGDSAGKIAQRLVAYLFE